MKPTFVPRISLIILLALVAWVGAAAGDAGCGTPPPDGGSCGGAGAELPKGVVRILDPSGRAEIPFKMADQHLLIPVRVGESEPFQLILDTGMPIPGAMLHPTPRSEALDLENPDGLRLIMGGADDVETRIGTGVTLSLPGVELTEQIVGISALPGCIGSEEQVERGEVRVEGVIGLSIFDNFVVTIDHDRQIVTLVKPDRYVHNGRGSELPITIGFSRVPEITCEVEIRPRKYVPVNVVVDTGAGYPLSLTLGTNDAIHLPKGSRDCVVGYSAWGKVTGSLGRVRSLRLGSEVLHDVLVTFFQKGAPGVPPCGENGILGNEVLRRFKTTFDYSRKRMILEAGSRFNQPFETDMCGILYVEDDSGALRITQVFPDSPASEAKIQEGDLLKAVNGKSTNSFQPNELRDLLQTDGAKVQFRIERAGQEIEVALRLRRLV